MSDRDENEKPRVADAEVLDTVIEAVDESLSTIWINPDQTRDWVADLYVGVQHGRAPRNYEEKTGLRRYRIKAGQERALPSAFDQAVQQTECNYVSCAKAKLLCRNREHAAHWTVIGGLGPFLVRKGVQRLRVTAALHSEQERLTAPTASPAAPGVTSPEDAALARAAARRAGR